MALSPTLGPRRWPARKITLVTCPQAGALGRDKSRLTIAKSWAARHPGEFQLCAPRLSVLPCGKKYTSFLGFLVGYPTDKRSLQKPYCGLGRAAVFDMPIRQYLDGERLDPETTRLLGIVFETAIQALRNRGVVDPPREAIARAIIGFAKAGERDPERLCDLALEACAKPIISDPSPLPPQTSRPDS
jgi:hypothetical protein